MTLLYMHQSRRHASIGGLSAGRVFKRLRAGLKTIHRAIAAAKIRRLRNELRLHAMTRANLAHPLAHEAAENRSADRFPRQPLHLGEKWDS